MSDRTKMFDEIDRMNADAWASYLAEDVTMKFGNGDPVHGRRACRDALAGFYAQIDGLRHDLVDTWEQGKRDDRRGEGDLHAEGRRRRDRPRRDDRTNGEDMIDDYRIFIDMAPVFA